MRRCSRLPACSAALAGLLALFACEPNPYYSDTGKGTYRDLSGVNTMDRSSYSPAGPGLVGPGRYQSGGPSAVGGQIPGITGGHP